MNNLHLDAYVERICQAEPRLHRSILVLIDGPSGSGKSTLAAQLHAQISDSVLVHSDDLLEGWSGLNTLDAQLRALIEPLSRGEESGFSPWNWVNSIREGWQTVLHAPVILIEGTGSFSPATRPYASLKIWVEAPSSMRLARGLERDSGVYDDVEGHWRRWAKDEQALFERYQSRDHADLFVDGTEPVSH